jgi:transcriptional regulator with XRE-family HTH domain
MADGPHPWLKAARKAAGLTQAQLAEIVGVTRHTVSCWESGRQGIYRRHLVGLASVLPDVADRLATVGSVDDVERRELLAGLGAMLVTPQMPALVDGREALRGVLVDRLARYKAAEAAQGAGVVVSAAEADLRLMRRAAGLSDALVWAAVGYASFVGWLRSDGGDDVGALKHRQTALAAAGDTGDANLIAYSLVGLALGRCDAGDGPGARRLTTDAAELDPSAAAVARYLARVTADAASLTGDRDTVERALDRVAELGDAPADDRYPWLEQNRLNAAYLTVRRATCYGNLGLTEEAAELWERALDEQPVNMTRDRGVYLARYAGVLATLGEQDAATAAAGEAADALDATGSVRLRRELRRLAPLS